MKKKLKISKKIKHGIMPGGGSCSLTTYPGCKGVLIYAVYKTPHSVMKQVNAETVRENLCY